MAALNETHDASLRSWVASANADGNGFPIQNLPFAIFQDENGHAGFRPGVAIGERILDLAALAGKAHWTGLAAEALACCQAESLNDLMALTPQHRSALRLELSRALREGSNHQRMLESLLHARDRARFRRPAHIGDYTDFYISLHHATAVGRQFRPDNPLLSNYRWVPIGYHGRVSSIGVSGQTFARPIGQKRPEQEGGHPGLGPCERLDYELELGIFIGQGNAQGEAIAIDQAEDHIFGLCLLNDWSARDLQAWEYQPLGPFLAKNFATTLSPWVVTLEALAPFRLPFERPASDPQPLPYLDDRANRSAGVLDVQLEVLLTTAASRVAGIPPMRLSGSNFSDAYWTMAQLVAHHTVNGCNLMPGDLLGTGTLSGPRPGQEGSMLELTQNGKVPLALPNGESRRFLEDEDEVILRARCSKAGYPDISFGECRGRILPARSPRYTADVK